MMEEGFLLISGIQHFCFCRRQWGLIHIENTWSENYLTADGIVMHERVHDNDIVTKHNGIVTLRALPVQSSRLKITGECDAVELVPDKSGIPVRGHDGLWSIHPVEYKRGKPKVNNCDRLQLVAQCICLEEMFACTISHAQLYYGEIRHRETVVVTDSLRTELENMIMEMWDYYQRGYTPRVKRTKSCDNCSLINQCMPEINSRKLAKTVSDYIKSHIDGEQP